MEFMENNLETYMPGFTHLQKAQPVTLAHHVGAYFEMFRRDHEPYGRYSCTYEYMSAWIWSPCRNTYPLDRFYTAKLLGFDGPTMNSMDGPFLTEII